MSRFTAHKTRASPIQFHVSASTEEDSSCFSKGVFVFGFCWEGRERHLIPEACLFNIGRARSFPKDPWERGGSSSFPKFGSATDESTILRVMKSFPFPSLSFLFMIVRDLSPHKSRFQRGPFCGLSVINASMRIVFIPLANRENFQRELTGNRALCIHNNMDKASTKERQKSLQHSLAIKEHYSCTWGEGCPGN